MDWSFLDNLIKQDLKKKCPQLDDSIIKEFISLTAFRPGWVTFCNKYSMYILGIVETREDFYYIGFSGDDDTILTASCALEFKKDIDKDNLMLIRWGTEYQEEDQERYRNIRKKLYNYLIENPSEKLIYFIDVVLDDEHLVYNDEENPGVRIEKIETPIIEKTFI